MSAVHKAEPEKPDLMLAHRFVFHEENQEVPVMLENSVPMLSIGSPLVCGYLAPEMWLL